MSNFPPRIDSRIAAVGAAGILAAVAVVKSAEWGIAELSSEPSRLSDYRIFEPKGDHTEVKIFDDKDAAKDEVLGVVYNPALSDSLSLSYPRMKKDTQFALMFLQDSKRGHIEAETVEFEPESKEIVNRSVAGFFGSTNGENPGLDFIAPATHGLQITASPIKKNGPSSWGLKLVVNPLELKFTVPQMKAPGDPA